MQQLLGPAFQHVRESITLLLPNLRKLSSAMAVQGPIASAIHRKIAEALQPTHFRLVNDSHKHAGHYARDGSAASEAGETHFRLEVISEAFAGVPLVKRHQLIYGLLADEFKAGLHALSMTTKTPAEK
ncbi:BolA-like protein 1 [Pleodorina starrii]|nr:BolA-like protein 1 [Pleodorina starrii]